MKCISCGAEITGDKCRYCGTEYRTPLNRNREVNMMYCTVCFGDEEVPCYVKDVIAEEVPEGIFLGRDINGKMIRIRKKPKRIFTLIER